MSFGNWKLEIGNSQNPPYRIIAPYLFAIALCVGICLPFSAMAGFGVTPPYVKKYNNPPSTLSRILQFAYTLCWQRGETLGSNTPPRQNWAITRIQAKQSFVKQRPGYRPEQRWRLATSGRARLSKNYDQKNQWNYVCSILTKQQSCLV